MMTHDVKLTDHKFQLHQPADIWPHSVWHKLWEVYCAFGCPQDNLHDMLCDFNNISRVFGDWKYEFFWYFEPGERFTVFDTFSRYDEPFGVHVKGDGDGEFEIKYLWRLTE